MFTEHRILDVTQRQIFIDLPESFVNHRIEIVVRTVHESATPTTRRRCPHPDIAGKGRTLGDLISPIIDESDWECLK